MIGIRKQVQEKVIQPIHSALLIAIAACFIAISAILMVVTRAN